ncbi:MAG: hypothetical protein ACOYXM_13620 [Actinomycetota bacterium]
MIKLPRRDLLGLAVLAAVVATAVALGPVMPWRSRAGADRVLERAMAEVALAEETTTTVPPTTTTVPTTTTAPPPPPTTTAPPQRFTLEPYRGLGAWLDVYDWSATFAQHQPAVEPDVVDHLAAQGVQTLFIQASKWNSPTDVLDEPRLLAFIERAHSHGISVVGWYLPTFEDMARDMQRLRAIAALPVDGIAVDIESRAIGDVTERNRRLIELSAGLRAALPGEVIGAIPLEPVLLEDVNPNYWPAFPWAELAPHYDVWLPMAYWTNRHGSSPWRAAHLYTAANIDRVRAHIGRPDAPVHALGGIGDQTTVADLQGFRAGATERGVIGGSIYDFRTTSAPHWPELIPFRSLRP